MSRVTAEVILPISAEVKVPGWGVGQRLAERPVCPEHGGFYQRARDFDWEWRVIHDS